MSLLDSRMTLRNLRLIVAIAAEGNLVRAAQGMNMTQSAVTKALQEVEATVGAALFDRTNRGVLPTAIGAALIAHAQVILAQIRHADQELADLRDGSSGTVVVGTLLAASATLLPRAILRVKAARPNLIVRIVEGTNDTLMPQLRNGTIDLVVGRLPVYRERDGVEQEPLFGDHAAVVARATHPLAARPALALADLAGYRWILPRPETTLRRQVDEAFRAAGLHAPTGDVESMSVLANRELLLHSDYLTVWPVELARMEVRGGACAILPVELAETRRPVGISTRAGGRLTPAAEVFIRALREVGATLSADT